MLLLLELWAMFAAGINWGNGGKTIFSLFTGDTSLILHGQLWRLFTAPLLHLPDGPGAVTHLVTTLLGLYFLGPSLEAKWGGWKFAGFLYGASISGFVLQMLAELALPESLSANLHHPWFGAIGAVEAVAIAWALSFRGRQIMLLFVLPVSSSVLVLVVVGMSLLRLLAAQSIPEGVIAPFGAMLFGWIVGGGDRSPLRRLLLRRRLRSLGAQLSGTPSIEDDSDDDTDDPSSEHGRWMN